MKPPPSHLIAFQTWMAHLFTAEDDGWQQEISQYLSPHKNLVERTKSYQNIVLNRHMLFFKRNLSRVYRFLGKERFQKEIMVPYFKCYPSCHWSLDSIFLDNHFEPWVRQHFFGETKEKILPLLLLDLAEKRSSLAKRVYSRDVSTAPNFFDMQFSLQPHVQLVSNNNIFYIIFRNLNNKILCDRISHVQFFVLKQLEKKASFHALEPVLFQAFAMVDFSELRSWFFLIDQRGWLIAS